MTRDAKEKCYKLHGYSALSSNFSSQIHVHQNTYIRNFTPQNSGFTKGKTIMANIHGPTSEGEGNDRLDEEESQGVHLRKE